MRLPVILALLAAPVLADEAADLFYRAFWLEQSGGKADEAEKLYRELIEKHAGAPEAPRAYLALVRMNAARGIAVDELLASLEKGYPDAKQEIEAARLLAARLRVAFDAKSRADDAPLERKLKTIYVNLLATGQLAKGDQEFLTDIGVAGHPMLAAALRSPSADAVYGAAVVLVQQKSEAADGVLVAALQDESVLYRLRVLDAIAAGRAVRAELVAALDELWPRASRSMRVRIARTWAYQSRAEGPIRTACYGYLARALRDESDEVRAAAAACNFFPPYDLPVAWAKAAMALEPSADPRFQQVERLLPWQLRHEEIRPALERDLVEREGRIWFLYPNTSDLAPYEIDEPLVVSWVRVALARAARNPAVFESNAQDDTKGLVWTAARVSADATRRLLEAGLERGDLSLLGQVRSARADRNLGDLRELKAKALEQWYAEDERRHDAAGFVLGYVGLGKDDLPAVLAAAKNHPGKGLPGHAKSNVFLHAIGPQAAAGLVPLALDAEIYTLFAAGMIFLQPAEGEHGRVFFEAIVPRTGPAQAALLRKVAGYDPRIDAAIARRLIEAEGPDWKWRMSESEARQYSAGAPALFSEGAVRVAMSSDALRPALYGAVADPRYELGRFAMEVAAEDATDGGLAALRGAMRSPYAELRERAIKYLGRRGPAGAAALVSFLQQGDLPDDLRKEAWTQLDDAAGAAQLPYVRARLDARAGGDEATVLWSIAFRLEREATIERAFREVFGEGPESFRDEALDILRRTSDERRIAVFRKVLREDRNAPRVHRVLRTVADQYLIELGPEVLLHLRNPDDGIRKTATTAIERLKFYAEAKKLFEGG